MTQKDPFLPLFLFSAFATVAFSQTTPAAIATPQYTWRVEKEEDGMKIFFRDIEEGKVEVKIVTTIATPFESLSAYVRNPANMNEWVVAFDSCHMLADISPLEFYLYTGFRSRLKEVDIDLIWHFNFMELPTGVVGNMTATPDYSPLVPGLQRLPYFDGTWAIQRVDKKTCKFTYNIRADLTGGNGLVRAIERNILLDAHVRNIAKLRAVFNTPG